MQGFVQLRKKVGVQMSKNIKNIAFVLLCFCAVTCLVWLVRYTVPAISSTRSSVPFAAVDSQAISNATATGGNSSGCCTCCGCTCVGAASQSGVNTQSNAQPQSTASVATQSISLEDYNKVDLNTASKEQLATLAGVGEEKANYIIEYRVMVAPFTQVEDVLQVYGITENMLESWGDNVYVSVVED